MRKFDLYIYTDRGFVLVERKYAKKCHAAMFEKNSKKISRLGLFAWCALEENRIVEIFDMDAHRYKKGARKYKQFRENILVDVYISFINWTFALYLGMSNRRCKIKLLRRFRCSFDFIFLYLMKNENLFFYYKNGSAFEHFRKHFKMKKVYG